MHNWLMRMNDFLELIQAMIHYCHGAKMSSNDYEPLYEFADSMEHKLTMLKIKIENENKLKE